MTPIRTPGATTLKTDQAFNFIVILLLNLLIIFVLIS